MRAALVHPQLLRSGVWGRSVLGRSEEIEQCADEPLPPGVMPRGYRRLYPVCGFDTEHIPNLPTSARPQLEAHDCCDPPLSASPRSAKRLANTSHALAPTSFAALGGCTDRAGTGPGRPTDRLEGIATQEDRLGSLRRALEEAPGRCDENAPKVPQFSRRKPRLPVSTTVKSVEPQQFSRYKHELNHGRQEPRRLPHKVGPTGVETNGGRWPFRRP